MMDAEQQRAAQADLVTLPAGIVGTNCFNCQYVEDAEARGVDRTGTPVFYAYCRHPKVQQDVSSHMCCAFWNAPGTLRDF